jgi:hypothetical protein
MVTFDGVASDRREGFRSIEELVTFDGNSGSRTMVRVVLNKGLLPKRKWLRSMAAGNPKEGPRVIVERGSVQ